jgi:hypothetical protein
MVAVLGIIGILFIVLMSEKFSFEEELVLPKYDSLAHP